MYQQINTLMTRRSTHELQHHYINTRMHQYTNACMNAWIHQCENTGQYGSRKNVSVYHKYTNDEVRSISSRLLGPKNCMIRWPPSNHELDLHLIGWTSASTILWLRDVRHTKNNTYINSVNTLTQSTPTVSNWNWVSPAKESSHWGSPYLHLWEE